MSCLRAAHTTASMGVFTSRRSQIVRSLRRSVRALSSSLRAATSAVTPLAICASSLTSSSFSRGSSVLRRASVACSTPSSLVLGGGKPGGESDRYREALGRHRPVCHWRGAGGERQVGIDSLPTVEPPAAPGRRNREGETRPEGHDDRPGRHRGRWRLSGTGHDRCLSHPAPQTYY